MYHLLMNKDRQSGFSVLEVLIGIAILGIVSTSIYYSFSNVLDIVQTAQYNNGALAIMESRIETARNMRYEDVGVVGGVPAGKILQTETMLLGNVAFTLHSYVRNIDDPFDGTLGGSPGDTAPADYKLVEYQVTCDACTRYKLLTMATYIAPKNLESASKRGNLFVRVLNANGVPISGATAHVTNTSVSPPVNLTDITNSAGILSLVDIATSSTGYHITVSKTGYSSDQTYPPGAPANPVKSDATVASQQLTISTLAIDHVGALTVKARDQFCAAVPGFDFLLTGGKLIGTSPNVPKYSTALFTAADGTWFNNAVEWDTYTLKPTDTLFDIAGTQSSLSFAMDPSMTRSISLMTASRSGSGLSVSITDPSDAPVNDALVRVTAAGYDQTRTTGSSALTQTDWQTGQFADKSASLDTSVPGQLTLLQSAGEYASGSEWLISNTYNLGTSSATFTSLNWTPTSQPAQVGPAGLQFQLAANNDNATWNWIGPDGTAGSFFSTPGQTVPASLNGNRFFRYRAYLHTANTAFTPTLQDVTVGFSSGCVPSGQAYVNGMAAGTYTVTVTRAGFQTNVSTVILSDPWQRTEIQLTP